MEVGVVAIIRHEKRIMGSITGATCVYLPSEE
jgi:hypothetical protein